MRSSVVFKKTHFPRSNKGRNEFDSFDWPRVENKDIFFILFHIENEEAFE